MRLRIFRYRRHAVYNCTVPRVRVYGRLAQTLTGARQQETVDLNRCFI
jgi:hypothetical protein